MGTGEGDPMVVPLGTEVGKIQCPAVEMLDVTLGAVDRIKYGVDEG